MIIADIQDVKTLLGLVGCWRQIRSVWSHFLSTERTIQVAVTNSKISRTSPTKSLPADPTFAFCKPYLRYSHLKHQTKLSAFFTNDIQKRGKIGL